jgi:hypothetical protein
MNIEVHNPEPMYLILEELVSDKLREMLIDLVDEHGTEAEYNDAAALECRLDIIPGPFSSGYAPLLGKIILASKLDVIVKPLMEKISKVFRNTACDYVTSHAGYWIMKYSHGGHFKNHVDYSTDDDYHSTPVMYTLSIHLNDDYTGGDMFLNDQKLESKVRCGYVWDGWTHHRVEPVIQGDRYVLVVHFTGKLKD